MSFLNKIRNWTIRDTEERGNSQEWFDLFFQRDEKQKEMISPLPKGQTITDNSEYGVQESGELPLG